jgi:hypothetical protein
MTSRTISGLAKDFLPKKGQSGFSVERKKGEEERARIFIHGFTPKCLREKANLRDLEKPSCRCSAQAMCILYPSRKPNSLPEPRCDGLPLPFQSCGGRQHRLSGESFGTERGQEDEKNSRKLQKAIAAKFLVLMDQLDGASTAFVQQGFAAVPRTISTLSCRCYSIGQATRMT